MLKKRGHKESGFFAKHKTAMAAATLIGTIVGAGILAVPYVVAQAGFLVGFFIIVLLGLAFIFLNLVTGEIVLRTKEQHQITGYAAKYLGTWGKRLMTFSMMFSIYGALTAYLIGEGETLKAIFNVGTPLIYSLIFFTLTFVIIYKGVKATGKAELVLITLLLGVVFLIGIFSYKNIDVNNLKTINLANFFMPYGAILFAYIGYQALPEMQEVLGGNREKMKKAIYIGSAIPILLYLLFSLFVVGIVGFDQFQALEPNQRIATIALSVYSSPILGAFANVIAVLAMFTSFLTLGIAMVEMYEYDYLISRTKSLLLTFSVPLFISVFSLSTFITVIGITGALAGGLMGILIILSYWKAKTLGDRKPEYSLKTHKIFGSVLIVMFALGIAYQFYTNFSF